METATVNGLDRAVLARFAAPAPPQRTAEAAETPREGQVQATNVPAKAEPAVEFARPSSTRISVDKDSKRIVTQIIGENNEVIRQIPPKDLLDISAQFKKLQGLLFDERA